MHLYYGKEQQKPPRNRSVAGVLGDVMKQGCVHDAPESMKSKTSFIKRTLTA
jgi:hypothetical protein